MAQKKEAESISKQPIAQPLEPGYRVISFPDEIDTGTCREIGI